MYVAVDHPSISCRDVRTLSTWYCETFGMRVIVDDGNAVLIGYGDGVNGAAMIEMGPATDPGPPAGAYGRAQPGIRHVALRVTDFDAAYNRLRRLGVPFVTDAPGQALGGGKTILFRDPEGNEVQIVQRR